MTDRDRVKELLDDFGVVYEERQAEVYESENYPEDPPWPATNKFHHEYNANITIRAGAGPKNDGYSDFVTVIDFDEEGNFMKWGAWE